jgi:hypothetical protein
MQTGETLSSVQISKEGQNITLTPIPVIEDREHDTVARLSTSRFH